jgi:hypothetical protein
MGDESATGLEQTGNGSEIEMRVFAIADVPGGEKWEVDKSRLQGDTYGCLKEGGEGLGLIYCV